MTQDNNKNRVSKDEMLNITSDWINDESNFDFHAITRKPCENGCVYKIFHGTDFITIYKYKKPSNIITASPHTSQASEAVGEY